MPHQPEAHCAFRVREDEKHWLFQAASVGLLSVTVDCVDLIPHEALVYDCVDRHSAYGGLMNPALVDAMELELAAKTDMTFATAASLAERLKSRAAGGGFIPNRANFERFFEASKPQPVPEDLQSIPHPIFGFVARCRPASKYGFVEAAAKARPDWQFVWIGNEKPGADLSALRNGGTYIFWGVSRTQIFRSIWHGLTCA